MRIGLQIVLAVLSLIPLAFAVMGIVWGAGKFLPEGQNVAELDNQFRYLSGMYLVVTFLIWWIIPNIERHGMVVRLVTAALFIGGLARGVSMLDVGPGTPAQLAGMALELGSPLLAVWQYAIRAK